MTLRRSAWSVLCPLALLVAGSGNARAQDCCQLTVDSSFGLECNPDRSVPRLQWRRSCLRYGFGPGALAALAASSQDAAVGDDEQLTQDTVREVFARSFAVWQAAACSDGAGVGFYFEQLPGEIDETAASFELGVRNEIAVLARTGEEWLELDYDPYAFAQTTLFFDSESGEVYDADIEINLDRGPYANCSDACSGEVTDLGNTLTHEIGHLLGLAHVTSAESTMSGESLAGEVDKRTLLDSDAECLCQSYRARAFAPSECSALDGRGCACEAPPIYGAEEGAEEPPRRVASTGPERNCAAIAVGSPGGSRGALPLLVLLLARRARTLLPQRQRAS